MALVTAAQVRDLIPQIAGTGEDTRLGTLIDQAESTFARWLGYPRSDAGTHSLEDTTYTVYPQPRRSNPRELALPIRPVVSITTIHQNSDESYDTLVASSDYTTDLADGVIRLVYSPACGSWLVGDRPIRVVLVAGHATAPAHIVQAVAYQVQYALGQARTAGAQSQSVAGKSATAGAPSAGIDPRAAALLASDRLWEHAIG